MCDQICVIEVPKISSQERVEAVIFCFSSGADFLNGVIEVPKISSEESVETSKLSGSYFRKDV